MVIPAKRLSLEQIMVEAEEHLTLTMVLEEVEEAEASEEVTAEWAVLLGSMAGVLMQAAHAANGRSNAASLL